ncbi:hypothetical protein E2C01_069303 [Portunus trituberculatus]|uniref:Uncharacterized protein n=1 Tax=Portunus trituberculatus TaxID=210409 RepID=A0A5B7HY70_PORTR|nr:hypothetical protein [Portunus trituberculatus]
MYLLMFVLYDAPFSSLASPPPPRPQYYYYYYLHRHHYHQQYLFYSSTPPSPSTLCISYCSATIVFNGGRKQLCSDKITAPRPFRGNSRGNDTEGDTERC